MVLLDMARLLRGLAADRGSDMRMQDRRDKECFCRANSVWYLRYFETLDLILYVRKWSDKNRAADQ